MSDAVKWQYLKGTPERDAKHPVIARLGWLLMEAARSSHAPSLPVVRLRFVQLVFTVARDWIRYEIDSDRVGHEDIAGYTRAEKRDDAVDALWRGVDDCDAKARLFCALCLSQGVQARIVPHWQHGQLAHVSAVFSADNATWVPVELTLSRAQLGDTQKDIPRETETGKWRTT